MSDYGRKPRRKYCQFCKDHAEYIDYKDTNLLRKFIDRKSTRLNSSHRL